MRYIVAAILCLLLLVVPTHRAAAQGYNGANTNCDGNCSFFNLAFSVIPTTGDPAADMAGLIAMGSTLLTLARLVQASTMQRSKSATSINELDLDDDVEDVDTRMEMDNAETTQG